MSEYIIYIYYGIDDKILYIGKTNNFIQRQKEHLTRGEEYMFHFEYVEKYLFKSELYRDIYELYLINKEKPIYNEQGVVEYVSSEELNKLEQILEKGEKIETIYRNDCQDFLTKGKIFLPDLEFFLLKEFAEKILIEYPKSNTWTQKDLFNFLFHTEEGWNFYQDNYYFKLRKQFYTEAQYKNNLNRFKLNYSFEE